MPASAVRIDGLVALRAALLALPRELVAEAAVIVQLQAEATAGTIANAYPTGGTGNLRRGLHVAVSHDQSSATGRVVNRAHHAYIYERGTKAKRHWANGKDTGIMPAGNVFIPIAMQRRRIMQAALVDLVRRAGLTVTT